MADLTTTYMGLPLRNPILVASSSLSGTIGGIRRCAEAGAGAIVLKSLFEEQIAAQINELNQDHYHAGAAEAYHYLQGYGMELGPQDYLQLVSQAKKEVDVPIIASLNCISNQRWADYSIKLERAGADAIELNIGIMPTHSKQEGPSVIDQYLRILFEVKNRLKIPVSMKVGPYFTSFANFADRISHDRTEAPAYSVGWFGKNKEVGKVTWKKVDALVLFNRFYKFDIDIDNLELIHGNPYSSSNEIHYTLRWLSLLAGKVGCDLAASTGIHDGQDAIKAILVGAKVVQVCSTLYLNGLEQIRRIQDQIREWLDEHGCDKLSDIRGRLSQQLSEKPDHYERLQYIKLFSEID